MCLIASHIYRAIAGAAPLMCHVPMAGCAGPPSDVDVQLRGGHCDRIQYEGLEGYSVVVVPEYPKCRILSPPFPVARFEIM